MNLTFEEALEKLEMIVKELESGTLSLDQSVKKYQEGIELSKFCSTQLTKAQEVVVKLMNQGEEVNFDPESES